MILVMLGIFLTIWANKFKGSDIFQKASPQRRRMQGESLDAPGAVDITGIHHMLNSLSFIYKKQAAAVKLESVLLLEGKFPNFPQWPTKHKTQGLV